MKEKYSLLLIFLFVVTPLVTITLLPANLWVLFNIVLFTIIIVISYNMENKKHAPGPLAQTGLLAGILCFETLLWGCANFIFLNPAISSVTMWQTVGVLAASSLTAVFSFAILGKRLVQIQKEN
ncbi:hypothetical protein ACQ0P8_05580 [Halodesulfovibrio aestuarii]|uniref:Uncharacterized protein n=1 Tax=Halodesulfovibrio aestuarii TaxID=126333 RepID=A0A8G2C9C2_9BACT|nr:hypothetical protein [Halodesulfovibrio aestuarii]SHI83327.1 hypothetical protein SAMN05660830_01141 [Halodesulfovibrio aestuarii]